MRVKFGKILTFVFAVLLLAACSTRKGVTVSTADVARMELVSHSPAVAGGGGCLTGSMKFTAVVDGNSMSARGTLKIKAGEGIRIGITALGLVEVACIEFLPENARLIYKLGKEYADVPYSGVSFLQDTGIDYKMLESVLLNRLFSPGGGNAALALDKMRYAEEEGCITAQTAKVNGVVYKFFVDKASGNLVCSEGVHDSGGKVVCRYTDFVTMDNDRPFPRTIELALEGVDTGVTLQFVLSRVNSSSFDFVPQVISPAYGKTDIIELINSFENR